MKKSILVVCIVNLFTLPVFCQVTSLDMFFEDVINLSPHESKDLRFLEQFKAILIKDDGVERQIKYKSDYRKDIVFTLSFFSNELGIFDYYSKTNDMNVQTLIYHGYNLKAKTKKDNFLFSTYEKTNDDKSILTIEIGKIYQNGTELNHIRFLNLQNLFVGSNDNFQYQKLPTPSEVLTKNIKTVKTKLSAIQIRNFYANYGAEQFGYESHSNFNIPLKVCRCFSVSIKNQVDFNAVRYFTICDE
jgi:hypothetical protein